MRTLVVMTLLLFFSGCYEVEEAPTYTPRRDALMAYEAAMAAMLKGDAAGALAKAESSYSADSKFDDAAWLYATLLGNAGSYDKALEIATTLTARAPDLVQAHLLEGILWDRSGNRDAAEKAYDRALECFRRGSTEHALEPAAALYQALTVFLRFGKLDGIQAINAVLERFPEHAKARYMKACMHDKDRAFLLRWFFQHPGGTGSSPVVAE